MRNCAVLGLGMMGKAIAYDLLNFDTGAVVHGFDISKDQRKSAEHILKKFGDRFITHHLDIAAGKNQLTAEFSSIGIRTTFGAIDYKWNDFLTDVCISVSSNFLDLGGNSDIVKKQR